MVERWMKERAAKSFGGPCMSKFVEENERKRIMRLKNMKSSIVKMSCNKHDNWTRNRIEKRRRELKKQSDFGEPKGTDECKSSGGHPDFDLCFRPITDTTKSGLKLRLTNKREDKPTNSRGEGIPTLNETAADKDKDNHNNHRLSGSMVGEVPTKKKGYDGNEGKENKSPSRALSNNTESKSKDSKSSRQSLGRLKIRKTKPTLKSSGSEGTRKHFTTSSDDRSQNYKVRYERKHQEHTKAKQNKETVKIASVGTVVKKAQAMQKKKNDYAANNNGGKTKKPQHHKVKSIEHRKTRMKSSPSMKRTQLHANRGVSIDALSKERLEALAILEELDSGPSWGTKRMENTEIDTGITYDVGEKIDKNSLPLRTQSILVRSRGKVTASDDEIPEPLPSFFDDKNPNPTHSSPGTAKNKDSMSIKSVPDTELPSYLSPQSENVLEGLRIDSPKKSVRVDMNEMMRKEICEEAKLNEYSDSRCSIYTESFESDLGEYSLNKDQDINVRKSPTHDNYDRAELFGDDVVSPFERDHDTDWTPEFEAESFFVPIQNYVKEN